MRRIYFKGSSDKNFLITLRMLNRFIIAETVKMVGNEQLNVFIIEDEGYNLAMTLLKGRIIYSVKVKLYKVEFKGEGRRDIGAKINSSYQEVLFIDGKYDEYLDEKEVFVLSKRAFLSDKEYQNLTEDNDVNVIRQKNLLKIRMYGNTLNRSILLDKLNLDIGGVYDIRILGTHNESWLDLIAIVDFSKLKLLNELLYVKVTSISVYRDFNLG